MAAVTLLLAAAQAGCGGHGAGATPPLARGRAVFAASCAGCHTLTGRDTGAAGGDLAVSRLDPEQIASFVRTMPVRLSPADVAAVAAYVRAERVRAGRRSDAGR